MSVIDQKFWFNGLPFGAVPAGLRFWKDGLPVQGVAGTQTLIPSQVASDDAFYVHVLEGGPSGDEVLPDLVSSDDVFYDPTTTSTTSFSPSLYDDTDDIYDATATPADVVTPGHVASDDAFYAPVVQPGEVGADASLYDDTDAIYSALARSVYPLFPSRVAPDDDFQSPVVITAKSILPDEFVDVDDVVPASVLVQIVLAPPFLVSDVQIYTPVDASTYYVFSEPYDDVDAFYAGGITTGSVDVLPPLFLDADVAYTPAVQRQSTQGGGGGGNPGNTGNNVKYATKVMMDESGLITELQMVSSTTKSNVNARMMIYVDSAGVPGALVAQSAARTGVVSGTNSYPLLVPFSVLAGQVVWVALHTDGNVNWLLGNSPAGSRYNTDLFSDGPSDPFGPSSVDNKKAPVIIVLLDSANGAMTPDVYSDAESFFSPSIGKNYSMFDDALVDEDFFYTPIAFGEYHLSLETVQSDDDVSQPVVSRGSVTLGPSLVVDESEFVIPVIGVGDGEKFPPHFINVDVFGESTVTLEGAGLPPSLVTDEDAFHETSVVSVYTLAPSIVPQDDATEDAGASPGDVAVQPSLVVDVDQHLVSDARREGGDTYLTPDCVIDVDMMYPTVSGTLRRAHRATLRGVSVSGVTLGATAKSESTIEGDRRAAQAQLEGNDA